MFFEAASMRCPERTVGWWIFKTQDVHDFEILIDTVKTWMNQKWEFDWRCKACGCTGHTFGVLDVELRGVLGAYPGEATREAIRRYQEKVK